MNRSLQSLLIENVQDLLLFCHNNLILPFCTTKEEVSKAQSNYELVKNIITSIHPNLAAEVIVVFCGQRLDVKYTNIHSAIKKRDVGLMGGAIEYLANHTPMYDQLGEAVAKLLPSMLEGRVKRALEEKAFANQLIKMCQEMALDVDEKITEGVRDQFWKKLSFCITAVEYLASSTQATQDGTV